MKLTDNLLAKLFLSTFMGSVYLSFLIFFIAGTDILFGTIFWETIFDFLFYEGQNPLIRLLIALFFAVSTGTLGGIIFPKLGNPWKSEDYEE